MKSSFYVQQELLDTYQIEFKNYPQLSKYVQEDVIKENKVKKRSYLLLRPERYLFLFEDGIVAYFKKSSK